MNSLARGQWDEIMLGRLAEEGVPIGVIARVVGMSPALVRITIERLIARGFLRGMPAAEWLEGPRATTVRPLPPIDGAEVTDVTLGLVWRAAMSRQEALTVALIAVAGFAGEPRLRELVAPRAKSRKMIDVLLCRARPKLRDAAGVEIETLWGIGYGMSEGHRAMLFAWLDTKKGKDSDQPSFERAGAAGPPA